MHRSLKKCDDTLFDASSDTDNRLCCKSLLLKLYIGVITGNEAPTAIAGLVTAASQVGLKETTDFIKNAVNTKLG